MRDALQFHVISDTLDRDYQASAAALPSGVFSWRRGFCGLRGRHACQQGQAGGHQYGQGFQLAGGM
jgi:hypothetical protein